MNKNSLRFLGAIFLTFLVSSAFSANNKNVIIKNSDVGLLQEVIKRGGAVVEKMKHVSVLQCDEALVSEMGLQEDLPVQALDANANTQVRANLMASISSGHIGLCEH